MSQLDLLSSGKIFLGHEGSCPLSASEYHANFEN